MRTSQPNELVDLESLLALCAQPTVLGQTAVTWILIGFLVLASRQTLVGAGPPAVANSKRSNVFTVPRGFVHRGRLYCARETVTEGELSVHCGSIFQVPLLPPTASKPRSLESAYWEIFEADPPFRWRFVAGSYWGVKDNPGKVVFAKRIPIDDLHYFHLPANERAHEEYRRKHKYTSDWLVSPVMKVAKDVIRIYPGGGTVADPKLLPGVLDFDLLPVGPHEAVLFLQHGNLVRVWQGYARPSARDRYEWDTSWLERKADSFYTSVREPLLAYGDRDNWFFLTPSGKLYFSRKPARGEDRKMEPFYLGEAAPLKAMITDCASGRTWCFTEPLPRLRDRMKPSYFELADGVRARPCVAKPSKDDDGLPPPLRALMPYARVLQAEKLIGSAHADRPSGSGR